MTERVRPLDPAVADWFASTNNPMAPVIRAVRDVIMGDPNVTETIKYRAPAFEHGGIICYFNWSAKKRASLIFPTGRKLVGDHPHLESGSNQQRMMYFDDLDDVAHKSDALRDVIDAYMASAD